MKLAPSQSSHVLVVCVLPCLGSLARLRRVPPWLWLCRNEAHEAAVMVEVVVHCEHVAFLCTKR
jgi:hypothetical protein